jgi:hypothetical protein
MNTNHTKGEWSFSQDWENIIKITAAGNQGFTHIADVLNPINTPYHSEMQIANAKLIAAAPDMLNALSDLLADVLNLLEKNSTIKLGTMGAIHIVKAKAAIKKAIE